MTRLELIARDLASVLSPQGERDWRRYVPMAKEVGARLCRQYDAIMPRDGMPPEGQCREDRRRAA